MNPDPVPPKPRGLGKAALILLAVYVVGILTGVGGGFFLVQRKVRQVMRGNAETRGPIDFIFAEAAADVAREAQLTPEESAMLRERMTALAGEFKQSRVRLVSDLRSSVQREVEEVTGRVDPTRRERLRAAIQKRMNRWGMTPQLAPRATPAPASVEKL